MHAELGSTNDRALTLAAEAVALPALVLAERQTAGRGRGANRWAAPAGTLTFTLLLEPPAGVADAALLAPVTGLVVAETAATLTAATLTAATLTAATRSAATLTAATRSAATPTAAEVGVKWPNDVFLRPAPAAPWGKLAGVLCESPRPDRVAVGVGLNLNSDPAAFPPNLASPPATLRRADAPHDAIAVLIDLLIRLESAYDSLPDGGLDPSRWAPRDLLAGRSVTVSIAGASINGTACGVTRDGALRVFDGLAVREVRSGTVDW